jgi:hypothetical protein
MKSLGLLVTSHRYSDHVIALVRAAHAKGVAVQVFLTGTARQLAGRPEFSELAKMAKITTGTGAGSALPAKDDDGVSSPCHLADQAQWAGFFKDCDRHVVL